MKRVLITGAAGGVAACLRKRLSGRYELTLSDVVAPDRLSPDERFVAADLAELDQVRAAVDGMDGVVHLGAKSVEDAFEPILQANLIGTYNLYEAARLAGVKRVVFASSNHVMGFYPRTETVGIDAHVRPDSRYGVSKAFGEALASLYADKYGVASLCIRIGNVGERPLDRRRLSIWLSPDDLTQLVRIGLEHPELHCEIVYGMSDNQRAWWDNTNAHRLGYEPGDASEDHAEAVLRDAPALTDSLVDRMQGGEFVATEKGGDPTKPDA